MKVLLALTLAGVAAASPLTKVIELLGKLEAEITAESEAAAKLSSEKKAWCKDTSVNLDFAIKTGTAKIADLEANIDKEKAAVTSLGSKVEDLVAKIAKDGADLDAATKIRGQEKADFEAEQKELQDIISAIQRAISILEREMARGGSAALVQVQSASNVVEALEALVKASAFSAQDAEQLTAFVQQQSEGSDADSGAPSAAVYAYKSGSIVDALEDLLEKAQAQLAAAREKEADAARNFALLKQSLEDSIKFDTKSLEEAKAASAENGEAEAENEGELAATAKDLEGDKASLAEVTKSCADFFDAYDAEVKSRAEELKAVKDAKEVLSGSTEGAASVTYCSADGSFLQLHRAKSGISSGADLANFEAVRFVRDLARKSHSQELAQLAQRMAAAVRFSSSNGEDPFVKVKGLIADLIAKLESEASQDAQHKAYCDKELFDTNAKKDEKSATVDKLTTKINQMTTKSAQLKQEIAALQKELADLAAEQSQMDKFREQERDLFSKSKADLEDGIKGVELALKMLKSYCGKGNDDHEAKKGATDSIISMLEMILSDFTKSLADLTSAEDGAQSEYEAATHANEIEKTSKGKDGAYKTKEAAELDKAVAEATGDRATTQTQLDALLEYLEKLDSICVSKPESYSERAARRAAEIAGLKQALKILDGEALLQRRSLRRA